MKTLSVIMPWPWLIFHHGKNVENRKWRTNYRGRILIHASQKAEEYTLEILQHYNAMPTDDSLEMVSWLGCIVGSVELVDCVQNYDSPWAEKDMWHWVLKDPKLFDEPIPAKGSLGLWEFTGDIGGGI